MSTEKMREEFEAAYAERLIGAHGRMRDEVPTWLLCDESGEYMYRPAKDAWWAWQASRAVLVVELPNSRSLSASDDPWSVRDWCKDAIEAAGVRVKL